MTELAEAQVQPFAPAAPRTLRGLVLYFLRIAGFPGIAVVALAILLQRRVKAPEPAVVALGALAGIVFHD